MKKIAGIIVFLIGVGASLLWAAHRTGDPDAPGNWLTKNESQVRRILNVPPGMGLAYKSRTPSLYDGYDKITLELVREGEREEFELIITRDGENLVYDRIYPIKDPFTGIRSTIKLDRSPAIGPEDAPVTIVKYSDYTCTYCRKFNQTMQASLLKKYEGRVRFYHKLFPAIGHRQHAQQSAVAGACAFRQGNDKFWAMHDELFQNVDKFAGGESALMAMARRVNLNIPEFKKCWSQQESLVDVARDQQEGILLRIDGTPTFFINGRPISGMPTEEYFYTIIDEELALAQQR